MRWECGMEVGLFITRDATIPCVVIVTSYLLQQIKEFPRCIYMQTII